MVVQLHRVGQHRHREDHIAGERDAVEEAADSEQPVRLAGDGIHPGHPDEPRQDRAQHVGAALADRLGEPYQKRRAGHHGEHHRATDQRQLGQRHVDDFHQEEHQAAGARADADQLHELDGEDLLERPVARKAHHLFAERHALLAARVVRCLTRARPGDQHRREDQAASQCADGGMGVPVLAHELQHHAGHRLRQESAHRREHHTPAVDRRALVVAAGHFRRHRHVGHVEQRITGRVEDQRGQHIGEGQVARALERHGEHPDEGDGRDDGAPEQPGAAATLGGLCTVAHPACQGVRDGVIDLGQEHQKAGRGRRNPEHADEIEQRQRGDAIHQDGDAERAGRPHGLDAGRQLVVGRVGGSDGNGGGGLHGRSLIVRFGHPIGLPAAYPVACEGSGP